MTDLVPSTFLEAFALTEFRPGQAEAIAAVVSGRDVLALLPTGGGKSLIYQLPALMAHRAGRGATVVVSPLVALMDDQVAALRSRGVAAVALHSGLSWAEQKEAMAQAQGWALIYVSPERVKVGRFRAWLSKVRIAQVAVDEAHCISQWGHDFRPDYMRLKELRALTGGPMIAVTATATSRVVDEIVASLDQRDPLIIQGGFERPNLSFSVEPMVGDKARVDRVAALLREARVGQPGGGRALIYAATRRRAKSVSDALRKLGFPSGHYHAGRTDLARSRAAAAFESGERPILVGTCAFGMGVDLPDVRLVAHVQSPPSLEAWYQEAGRAGRDGAPARCVLLYGDSDSRVHQRLRAKASYPGAEAAWQGLQRWVHDLSCRQAGVVEHFTGDAGEPCGRCDVCTDRDGVLARLAALNAHRASRRSAQIKKLRAADAITLTGEQLGLIEAFVDGLKRPVSRTLVAKGLRGSRAKAVKRRKLEENPQFGALKDVPERALLSAIDDLLDEGRLARKGRKYPTVWMPQKRVRPAQSAARKAAAPKGLGKALKNYRRREASRRRWKAYQVFTNATLAAIAAAKPRTLEELEAVPGMGPTRVKRYGQAILTLVESYGASKETS